MAASMLAVAARLQKAVADKLQITLPAAAIPKVPAAKKKATAPTKKAVPLAATAQAQTRPPIAVTVNTGVVVDKRGLVDAVSSAFNEVSDQLGRPITMNVAS